MGTNCEPLDLSQLSWKTGNFTDEFKDKSFVAALTLEGWKDRPKCFEFLQCTVPPISPHYSADKFSVQQKEKMHLRPSCGHLCGLRPRDKTRRPY